MAKKLPEAEKVWVIVSSEGYIDSFPTLLSAQKQAKIHLSENETTDDIYILEVVRAWYVEFPQEPEPEVYDMGLEGLP